MVTGTATIDAETPVLVRKSRRSGKGLLLTGGVIVAVFVFCAFVPGAVAHRSPIALHVGDAFLPPSSDHWLGTDEVGRDLFTRVVYGARYSLGMAMVIVLVGAALGTAIGTVSGMMGGLVDTLLMRLVDVCLSLPPFILALAIAATLGGGIVPLVLALAVVWWPSYARFVRGIVVSLRSRPHVDAARTLGVSRLMLAWRHILPFGLKQLNVRITQDFGYALVSVASLGFVGLGAHQPTPEWGLLLSSGRNYMLQAWWYAFFPGAAIALLTLGFSMLGDGIANLLVGSTQKARPPERGIT